MKICFITDTYQGVNKVAGFGMYTHTAAHAMAGRGHEVHVLVGVYGQEADRQDGPVQVHVRYVRWLPLVGRLLPGLGESVCLAWALRRLQRRHRFDVVECPNWEGMGLVAVFLRIATIVIRSHTQTREIVRISGRRPTRAERFTIWTERITPKFARAVITQSETQRRWIEAETGLAGTVVIPHGIDVPKSAPAFRPDSKVVLYVGALNARKDIGTLLAAVPVVLAKVPHAKFWIVGGKKDSSYELKFRAESLTKPQGPSSGSGGSNGSEDNRRTSEFEHQGREGSEGAELGILPWRPWRPSVQVPKSSLVEAPGLRQDLRGESCLKETILADSGTEMPPGAVKFFGHVPRADLLRRYEECAVYASPSLYESFGLPFVEAMSYGKPVVACATSAMPEVIEDGITGRLVPPRDAAAFAGAIIELLENTDLRRRMGEAGRARMLEKFTAAEMAERYEVFVREIDSRVKANVTY